MYITPKIEKVMQIHGIETSVYLIIDAIYISSLNKFLKIHVLNEQ